LKFLKRRKRDKLRGMPFPQEWVRVLETNFPLYNRLSDADRRELQGHIHVLLEEKRFEGCGGLEMTDEVRVTIAGQACVLLLHRETDYFPAMSSIFVYPSLFVSDVAEEDADGVVKEFEDDRSGESWDRGPVVLSWEDALAGALGRVGGYNSVIHEFAHQLDMENGAMDGAPKLETHEQYDSWENAFSEAYRVVERNVNAGRPTAIDDYGLEGPDEFFAVVAEHFFQTPHALAREHPNLYGELEQYFRQDPASWTGEPGASRTAGGQRRRASRSPKRRRRAGA